MRNFLFVFLTALAFSSYAVDGLDDSIKKNIEEAKQSLGEIKSMNDFKGEWLFIEGSKDTFMLTKNGRFSLAAIENSFRFKDLWLGEEVDYAEFVKRRDGFPISFISQRLSAAPLFLRQDEKQVAKYSVLLMAGEKHSINFFKENGDRLAELGAHIYVMPGDPLDSFYEIMCSSTRWQLSLLKGEDVSPDIKDCDKNVANHRGTQNLTIANMLGITNVPFIIQHSDWAGYVVDSKVFEALTKGQGAK